MYAIIRTGGKQAKVHEGDVIDDKGKVFSGRDELKTARVTAKVVGETSGDKVDIFKYKAKTGYRRRGGHRQKYTTIEVTQIEGPKKAAAKAAPAATTDEPAAEVPAGKPAARKPAAKKESRQ